MNPPPISPINQARIPPLDPQKWPADVDDLFDVMARHPLAGDRSRDNPGQMFSTLVHHPRLLHAWFQFTSSLREVQTLSDRDREVVVLRTGWRCQAPYEWGQHVAMALRSGLSHGEIEQVIQGPTHPRWNPRERALLVAVDELHDSATISAGSWNTLEQHFPTEQLVEIPVVVGWYHLVAFLQNALGIPIEDGAGGLESR